MIFGQTRQLMGGRLRLVLTGGAPLSPDTHELIKICLCVKVIQGYGLTETCSSATVMDSKLNSCTHSFTVFIISEVVMMKRNITFPSFISSREMLKGWKKQR